MWRGVSNRTVFDIASWTRISKQASRIFRVKLRSQFSDLGNHVLWQLMTNAWALALYKYVYECCVTKHSQPLTYWCRTRAGRRRERNWQLFSSNVHFLANPISFCICAGKWACFKGIKTKKGGLFGVFCRLQRTNHLPTFEMLQRDSDKKHGTTSPTPIPKSLVSFMHSFFPPASKVPCQKSHRLLISKSNSLIIYL